MRVCSRAVGNCSISISAMSCATSFRSIAETEPEVLAYHFTEAGLGEVALEWWRKAGQQALKRSAYTEAIAHLGKAVAIADGLPDEPGRTMNRLASSNRIWPRAAGQPWAQRSRNGDRMEARATARS